MNLRMEKEAPATATDMAEAILLRETARRKRWRRAWFVGAVAGTALGALNLLALSNPFSDQWKLLSNCFLPFDLPLIALFTNAKGGLWDVLNDSNPAVQLVCGTVVIVGYWIAIGVFLASLHCLVRAGVIKRILRDRFCRRVLFWGIAAGMLIGVLNVVVIEARWVTLIPWFAVLDVPAGALLEEAREQLHLHFLPFESVFPPQHIWLTTFVVYWLFIGFFLASVFCVFRVGTEDTSEI